jgi:hypothetical protein
VNNSQAVERFVAHSTAMRSNAVLAAVGYNFRHLVQWLRFLLLQILITGGFIAPLKAT